MFVLIYCFYGGCLFLSRHRNRRKKTFRNLRFLKTSLCSARSKKTARGASHIKTHHTLQVYPTPPLIACGEATWFLLRLLVETVKFCLIDKVYPSMGSFIIEKLKSKFAFRSAKITLTFRVSGTHHCAKRCISCAFGANITNTKRASEKPVFLSN